MDEVGIPVNVLALPGGPTIGDLAAVGVRRVSTGSLLASAAYGALVAGARELRERGHVSLRQRGLPRDAAARAFG